MHVCSKVRWMMVRIIDADACPQQKPDGRARPLGDRHRPVCSPAPLEVPVEGPLAQLRALHFSPSVAATFINGQGQAPLPAVNLTESVAVILLAMDCNACDQVKADLVSHGSLSAPRGAA